MFFVALVSKNLPKTYLIVVLGSLVGVFSCLIFIKFTVKEERYKIYKVLFLACLWNQGGCMVV